MPKLSSFMRIVRVQHSRSRTGQYLITLPKDVVQKFNLKKGDELAIVEDENFIKLIPAEKLKQIISLR